MSEIRRCRPTCTAFVPLGGQVPTDLELEAAGQLKLNLMTSEAA